MVGALIHKFRGGTRAHCALGLAVKPTGVVLDKLFSEGLGVNGYYPTHSPIDTVLVAGMARADCMWRLI